MDWSLQTFLTESRGRDVADRPEQLEALIAKTEPVLLEAEKQRFFISDPLQRRRMESEIQRLQKQLFQHRKELAVLRDPDPGLTRPASTTESSRPRVFISYNRA